MLTSPYIEKDIYAILPLYYWMVSMAEIVEVDKAGRIVIPKSLRDKLGIKRKTRFILTERGGRQLLLQQIDVEEMARRLEGELVGKDVDAIVKAIRKEINEKCKVRYPELFT